jgi:hypothetical protein
VLIGSKDFRLWVGQEKDKSLYYGQPINTYFTKQ